MEGLSFISQISESDGKLKIKIAYDKLKELNKALIENGVEVSAVIPRSSLEDYFLSLTGEGI